MRTGNLAKPIGQGTIKKIVASTAGGDVAKAMINRTKAPQGYICACRCGLVIWERAIICYARVLIVGCSGVRREELLLFLCQSQPCYKRFANFSMSGYSYLTILQTIDYAVGGDLNFIV